MEAGQLWQTLWGDFDLVLYGPAGYVGPPHAIRAQFWLSQPDQIALLAGPVDGDPDYHFYGNDRGFFQAMMDNLLHWHYFTSWEPKINGKSTSADLFAGDYYLGSLEVSDPFWLNCDRSPDGARLALAEGRKRPAREQSLLTWIDLSDAKNVNTLELDLDLSNFAFAPEGRLAIFGYGKHFGSLYVLDTDSGELTKLLDLAYLRSLMWSPDGEYLTLTGNWRTPDYGEEMMMVQVSTGEVTYLSQDNTRGQAIAPNWPVADWGKAFPEGIGSLAACAGPPEQQAVFYFKISQQTAKD